MVTLLEGTDDIGGHSKTWVEPVDGGDLPIDIGFIFNNVHYYKYINFTTYFDYPLHDTALNTSGAFNGRYWDNVHSERGVFGEEPTNWTAQWFHVFSFRGSGDLTVRPSRPVETLDPSFHGAVTSPSSVRPEELEIEVDRFLELVKEPEDTFRYLTPLGAFLWWHGFSDDFYRLCLTSIISVLFAWQPR
eukprot:g28421.t1